MGYRTDKRIESDAFWAADNQRIEEENARNNNKLRLHMLQKNIKNMWEKRAIRKHKESSPGPLDY